jgi:cytochrome c peroxidase
VKFELQKRGCFILVYLSMLGFGITSFNSCNFTNSSPIQLNVIDIPAGFPEIEFPEGNEYSKARWELGKKLFNDPVLSRDSSISCASCHHSEIAFGDATPTTSGVYNRAGQRNVPTLANVAYSPYFMVEGSVSSLELQVLVPIQEHNEFDHTILDIGRKLRSDSAYVNMALMAYGREIDPFVITRAIANFERSMISGTSAYDSFRNGDLSAISEKAKRGMDLFYSEKVNCKACHSGVLFTNYSFENNGLSSLYADSGRIRLTMKETDRDKFKVPTLRNIAVTGPYMHDGSFSTLIEIIEHYNSGGKNHLNKSDFMISLNLTNSEKEELVAFLESLTDYSFINDPKWN